jgi:hypothetical protein
MRIAFDLGIAMGVGRATDLLRKAWSGEPQPGFTEAIERGATIQVLVLIRLVSDCARDEEAGAVLPSFQALHELIKSRVSAGHSVDSGLVQVPLARLCASLDVMAARHEGRGVSRARSAAGCHDGDTVTAETLSVETLPGEG